VCTFQAAHASHGGEAPADVEAAGRFSQMGADGQT